MHGVKQTSPDGCDPDVDDYGIESGEKIKKLITHVHNDYTCTVTVTCSLYNYHNPQVCYHINNNLGYYEDKNTNKTNNVNDNRSEESRIGNFDLDIL